MDFKAELKRLLRKVTKKDIELTVPPDPELGDYAYPCFQLGKNPKEAAEKLQQKVKLPSFIQKTQVVGPYLNFFLNHAVLAESVLKDISTSKSKYGTTTGKETVMVEFFHANTHKGVHIGHIRNIAMGVAICNLLEAVGNNVIRVNYQGDIGPHVAKCIWAYQHFKEKPPQQHKGIWLGKLYAKATAKLKDNEQFQAQVKELNTKIYQHDPQIEPIWKKTRKWCLDDFNEFYRQFGVKYDQLYFESDAAPKGRDVFRTLLKKKVAKESEGAIIVDLTKYGLDIYVGVTSQGNPTYQGKELGLAELKLAQYKVDKSIHVVGSEQELFFKQVFKTYELMKSPLANKSVHVSYGLVNLPEGKMSSRLGTMILYHNLYEELMKLASSEIKKRHKLSKKDLHTRAELITFGALKYSMIARENQKTLTFDWKKALDFEGDTGPYIQYAHARCASILRKGGKVHTRVHYESLSTAHEHKLVLHLSKYPDVVRQAAENYKPYLLAKYVFELAQYFNEFYHNCPVISDMKEVMAARLLLVRSVKQVLQNGLSLLGITAPEEM